MQKTPKRRIGDIGERVASKYLENIGFLVLTKNYLKPWGEIDIVAKQGSKLHFIEVKTVSHEPRLWRGEAKEALRPEENMHKRKILRLHRAIQTYLLEHKIPEKVEWQIDLACIYLDFSTRRATVKWFENVI